MGGNNSEESTAGARSNEGWKRCLGHGTFAEVMLSSWSSAEKRMADLGQDEVCLQFIYHTAICPKGHMAHMSQNAAAKRFFPSITEVSAKMRVLNCTLAFIQQIFAGQHVEHCLTEHKEAHKKPERSGIRPRLSLEDKARRLATKEITSKFREQNNLGERGRLSQPMQEKFNAFLTKYLDRFIEAKTSDIKGHPR